jgi:2,3-bisphosphoglycerate-independent phosphoglycerate mutase
LPKCKTRNPKSLNKILMKYAIIIPDGCADEPQESLGGKTPLQAAKLPNMDRIARLGVVGRSNNVPQPLTPASDVATLSLFGYDPLVVYTNDWAVRCNLVCVKDGKMHDFTAGHINNADGARLMATVQEKLGGSVAGGALEFHAGVQYRNILVYRAQEKPAPFTADTTAQPPHDIPERAVADYLPKGPGAEVLRELMQRSIPLFADHPVNRERTARGDKPATQIWLWGQGRAPSVQPFSQIYGPRGAIVSAVDLVRGTGMLIGWNRQDAPGATGYLDTDYASKGRTGVTALKGHDLVSVHVEAPDEASHEGRTDEKIKALEQIDQHIVGPLLEALPAHGDWRILVSPDHRTPLRTRAHAYGMVPFAVAGTGVVAKGQTSYDEAVAAASDLEFDPGWKLMKWFLG